MAASWSDLFKTFALSSSDIPSDHLEIWNYVQAAQTAAHQVALNGTIAQDVDAAARKVLKDAGYGDHFTHRLGHGEPEIEHGKLEFVSLYRQELVLRATSRLTCAEVRMM
jgi:hypothetical protein